MSAIAPTEKPPEKIFRVLQVEDNPGYARLIESLLDGFDRYRFDLVHVEKLDDALRRIRDTEFDIVLLDLSLPDSGGLATLETVYQAAPELPIILLTNTDAEEITLKAVQYGAQDFLVKGQFNGQLLMRVIWYAVDRKQAELDLAYMAQHDPLTGLANRQLFLDRLEQAILRARRNRTLLALLYLDLDHFKSINDNLGHEFGDLLLQQVAERIQSRVRAQDTVARLGGDEFTVILEDVADRESVVGVTRKIIDALSGRFPLREHELYTNTSVGIAVYDGGNVIDARRLLKEADMAMYRAKQQPGSYVLFFSRDMDRTSNVRTRIENALRDALAREEFELEYQPQVDVQTGRLVGAEALLRWRNTGFGECPVGEIIDILEQIGMIAPVGRWVLETACRQWRAWADAGVVDPDSTVSVNFSARQFWQQNLVGLIGETLARTGLEAGQLDLELTESLLLKNNESNVRTLTALDESGVSVTIDDFGTGFSSLSYLKHFPISRLKIDRSFVRDILQNEEDAAIASAIIELARNLRKSVVAEGVDSLAKVRFLQQRGCRVFQGNYFSRPLPAGRFVEFRRSETGRR